MGARALLQYACAYPNSCDAFILIGCNPGIEDDSERSDRCAADTLLAQDIETYGVARFLSNWEETPLIRAQQGMRSEWRAQMRANRLEHQAEGLAASLRQFGQGSCPNLWPQLSKLAMPILLITGSEDTKYTDIAKRMQSELPNAAHQVINGASHAPHFEAPETTAQVIDAFISG